jgi:hypothetical protein
MSSDLQGLEPPPPPPPADPAGTRGSRSRVVGIALAIAVVGAVAGFAVTRAASPTLASTAASASTPSPSPSGHKPSFGPRGGFGFACGGTFAGAGFGGPSFFGGRFCGGETGTVTKISGSTLTLRTLAGTVTVTTKSTTTYSREEQQAKFSAIKVGDVVAVRGDRSGTNASATSPIAATAITIVVPSISGRVQSVSGGSITLVTGDGQLETVMTSSATRYHGVRGATATSSSLKAGVYVVAQGTQVNLTTLDADNIEVLGNFSFVPHSFPGHSSTAPMPGQPGGATKPV